MAEQSVNSNTSGEPMQNEFDALTTNEKDAFIADFDANAFTTMIEHTGNWSAAVCCKYTSKVPKISLSALKSAMLYLKASLQ